MKIAAGAVRLYVLFDVADTIDLRSLRLTEGEGLAPAEIPLRQHASPAYLQFPVPPLVARLPDAPFGDLHASVRVKFFDYGVISLRLSFDARGAWDDLPALAARIRRSGDFVRYATSVVQRICDELGPALDDRHEPLVEDYLILDIERLEPAISGAELLGTHGAALSALLLGEEGELARTEIDESLRVRFSYLADDLTILQWDTALIYDRRESNDAIQDILEFANSQLLELRTYDARLDRELDVIYADTPARTRSLLGRRAAGRAAEVRYLIVDVLELLDRSTNALKVVGDAYYARIYRAAAQRLGLADWQHQLDRKLASVGDMYRFFNDESRSRRDEFMELIVIVLIALEVVIGVVTLLRH